MQKQKDTVAPVNKFKQFFATSYNILRIKCFKVVFNLKYMNFSYIYQPPYSERMSSIFPTRS